eukprot:27162-Amphidinium_carterae.1
MAHAACAELGGDSCHFDVVEHIDGEAYRNGQVKLMLRRDDAATIGCNEVFITDSAHPPLQSHVIQIGVKGCAADSVQKDRIQSLSDVSCPGDWSNQRS